MKQDARIEQTLNEIVRRLVADYQPEKISSSAHMPMVSPLRIG